jgi:multidrug efflux system membrane fusion protein
MGSLTRISTWVSIPLVLSVLVAACGEVAPPAAPPAGGERSVHVAAARMAVLETSVRVVGLLAPKDEVRLGFKIGGVVASIAVDAGDSVRRGDVLAVLDQTEIDAAVERAAEAAEKAARDLARTRALFDDDVATLEQVEHSTTALNIARADLEVARFDARYARIEAPADGVVLRRLAEPGELVGAADAVIVVGSLAEGWAVRAAVTDRDVVQLAIGDAARVAFDAFPGDVFSARVERIAAGSDPATGTYEVELAIEPNGRSLVEGLVAKVELDVGQRARPRLWIPVEALLEADGGYATVFVAEAESTVQRRRVRIGDLSGDRVEVREGLSPGDRVVTDGAAWVEDGARVVVLAEAD